MFQWVGTESLVWDIFQEEPSFSQKENVPRSSGNFKLIVVSPLIFRSFVSFLSFHPFLFPDQGIIVYWILTDWVGVGVGGRGRGRGWVRRRRRSGPDPEENIFLSLTLLRPLERGERR